MGTVDRMRGLARRAVRQSARTAPDTPPAGAGQPGSGQTGSGPKGPGPHVKRLEREVAQMKQRIALLERELQESRQLNKRVAEITDVVAEVLLPAEQRDEERLRAVLEKYETSL